MLVSAGGQFGRVPTSLHGDLNWCKTAWSNRTLARGIERQTERTASTRFRAPSTCSTTCWTIVQQPVAQLARNLLGNRLLPNWGARLLRVWETLKNGEVDAYFRFRTYPANLKRRVADIHSSVRLTGIG